MCYRLGALGRSVAGAVTVSATEGDPVTEKVAVVRRHSQSGPPERDNLRRTIRVRSLLALRRGSDRAA